MCGILFLILQKRKDAGTIGGIYLILYGVMRFLLEIMRGDHTDSIFGLTPSQFIAAAVAIPAGVIVCCLAVHLGKKKEREKADA